MRTHFAANVDPQDLDEILAPLDPARTLFIICSKSFTTEETLTNALRARAWLRRAGATQEAIAEHTLAVTTNIAAAEEFGIRAADCFPIWDWVGGRYSLWSAVGLAIALQGGWSSFDRLLSGARRMDEHTLDADGEHNLPLMMALLEFWNMRCLGSETHLVLPYSQRLEHLPDFLQQLSMESNGKGVDLQGQKLTAASAPVLWGSAVPLASTAITSCCTRATEASRPTSFCRCKTAMLTPTPIASWQPMPWRRVAPCSPDAAPGSR